MYYRYHAITNGDSQCFLSRVLCVDPALRLMQGILSSEKNYNAKGRKQISKIHMLVVIVKRTVRIKVIGHRPIGSTMYIFLQ